MRKKQNYLDFIPRHRETLRYTVNEENIVTLELDHKGFYHTIAQKVFHKPKTTFVALDQYGSFVWQQIDGTKSVLDVCRAVEAHFNEKENAHLNRIVKYFQILDHNRFITMQK